MVKWLNGWMVGWLDGWIVGWLDVWMVGLLDGWMVGICKYMNLGRLGITLWLKFASGFIDT